LHSIVSNILYTVLCIIYIQYNGCRLVARLVFIVFEDTSSNLAMGMWQCTMWHRSLGFDVHYLTLAASDEPRTHLDRSA
jgi:hypothetical protein